MSRERFHAFVQHALLSLPQLLKLLLRMSEDPDLPDECRVAAAGAVTHWLAASNTIRNQKGVLGYLDDVLVMYLVLEKLDASEPEEMARYRRDTPDVFSELGEQLALIRSYLGKNIAVVERAAETLEKLRFKGRTARQCVQDEEAANWFYEEVQSAMVDLDLEEEDISRALRGLEDALDDLRQRAG
jgi:uncharacterized membrane protein YkvA (DUF1232 family)